MKLSIPSSICQHQIWRWSHDKGIASLLKLWRCCCNQISTVQRTPPLTLWEPPTFWVTSMQSALRILKLSNLKGQWKSIWLVECLGISTLCPLPYQYGDHLLFQSVCPETHSVLQSLFEGSEILRGRHHKREPALTGPHRDGGMV